MGRCIKGGIMKLNDLLFSKSNYNFDTIIENTLVWTRKNRWKLILLIFSFSLFTIVMVSNVRTINSQLADLRKLEHQYNNLTNNNKVLMMEISRLESPERIIKLAEEDLKMITNNEIPYIIKVK